MWDPVTQDRSWAYPKHFRRGRTVLYLTNLDENRRDVALANEAHKKRVKAQYNKSVQPRVFNEGDMVLTYDHRHEKLGKGKFESMWYGPFIVSKFL